MKTAITALLLFLSVSAMAQPDRVHCGKEKTGYLSNGELYPGLFSNPYIRPPDGVWLLVDNNWPFQSKYYLNCKPVHELPLDGFGVVAVGLIGAIGLLFIRKQLWEN